MLSLLLMTAGFTAVLTWYLLYLLKPAQNGACGPSTSLDAFIDPGLPRHGTSSRGQRWTYSGKGRQVLVLFATEYGFSEELANSLLNRLKKLSEKSHARWQPRMLNARHHQHLQWDRETTCFFIVSTCGDGVFPVDCRSLVSFLQTGGGGGGGPGLGHLRFSLLAPGDSSYPHFCRAGLQLTHRLKELGAQEVVKTTRVDGEDWGVIEGWMDGVEGWVGSREAEEACPDLRQDYLKVEDIVAEDDESGASGVVSRHRLFLATLKTKRLLTRVEDVYTDRETIHCELDITGSGLVWTPGDSLGLYAENPPGTVDCVLSVLALTGLEILPDPKPAFRGQGQMTVREALLWSYDVKKATPATLSVLSQHVTPAKLCDRSRLSHLLSSKEACAAYLDSRHLVRVLGDWCGPRLPHPPHTHTVRSLLSSLRPLQPRYYSISSSPLLNESRPSLTVAVVRYVDQGREEGGVATTFLQDRLEVGRTLPVFVGVNPDFRLAPSPSTPLLLIGAGTGIAPYLAFIQSREVTNSPGKIHLYFGCRHPEKDFLYRQQIERWEARGVVRARVAFSRHQGRVYVQDLLKEDGALVWSLMHQEGAVVYVCGDAGRFAPDVERALVSIVEERGQRSPADARGYLADLQQAVRYQKDVWLS